VDTQDDSPQPDDHAATEAGSKAASDGDKPIDIDGKKALLAGGILLLVVIVVVGIVWVAKHSSNSNSQDASATTQPKGISTACGSGTWPKLYQGEPKNLAAATDTGFYVWVDTKGWHLRAIDTGSTTQFKGTITTDIPIADAKRYKQVPADNGKIEVKGNTVSFEFPGGPTAKGIDFTPCASSFRIDMGTPDLPWPVQSIWVGPTSKAVSNPIKVDRQQP
jgi:hypothetical protein